MCASCSEKLKIIQGPRCRRCSRNHEQAVCSDCFGWQESHDPLKFNHSVYAYNEQMQKIISNWKYRGDYILGNAFKRVFIQMYAEVFSFLPKDACVVPIPLSKARLKERGFNQAKVLADFLPTMSFDLLTRKHSEKQSKKTRQERLTATNPFNLMKTIHEPVVLVDDIYTTGTTLRHAASLLKKQGCPEVYAYTLIRG